MDAVTEAFGERPDASSRTDSMAAVTEYQADTTPSAPAAPLRDDDTFPGVIPIDEGAAESGDLEAQFDVVSPLMVNIGGQSEADATVIPVPNAISSR